jgi:rSAM/selenodomain-associated transferase 1
VETAITTALYAWSGITPLGSRARKYLGNSLIRPDREEILEAVKGPMDNNLLKRVYWFFGIPCDLLRTGMVDPYESGLILFFVRYPEPGEVKTRLAASIGALRASELYSNFILDILSKLKSSPSGLKIYFYPEKKRESLINWLGAGFQYAPQRGHDLGERMRNGFMDSFKEGGKRTILIGSDFPDLPLSFLEESLDALNDTDAVIGPAVDGGYYLIGFKNDTFFPKVFEGIEWGTSTVFKETLSRLRDYQCGVHILPPWDDVDTFEDLGKLVRRAKETRFLDSHTMSYLSSHKIIP